MKKSKWKRRSVIKSWKYFLWRRKRAILKKRRKIFHFWTHSNLDSLWLFDKDKVTQHVLQWLLLSRLNSVRRNAHKSHHKGFPQACDTRRCQFLPQHAPVAGSIPGGQGARGDQAKVFDKAHLVSQSPFPSFECYHLLYRDQIGCAPNAVNIRSKCPVFYFIGKSYAKLTKDEGLCKILKLYAWPGGSQKL